MNRLQTCICVIILLIAVAGFFACKHEPVKLPAVTGNYPAEVSAIISNKCATAGCHNAGSYENAGGLLLDTWEHMFDGGGNGAVVVPYSVDYSSLLYFINTDSTLGPVATPTMPLDHPPLSKEEYLIIRDWVANGAPSSEGVIPFADNPASRQKIYMVYQGCDMIGVVDAAKEVVMRYIPVGKKPYPESLTYIRLSPDGRYAYVCFWYSDEVLKIDTYEDKIVATYTLNNNFWSTMQISPDGQKLVLTNGDDFALATINTLSGQVDYHTNTGMANPLGIAANATFDTFYITSQYGNTVYKYAQGTAAKISIDGNALTTSSGNTPDPYEIIMSPDHSKYFIGCEKSGEVRVMNRANDQLLKTISVGKQPRGMAVARSKPYLFVACMDDDNANAGFKGSVYVIDYNTLDVVQKIEGRFYQPHSIAVNEQDNSFYIFNRNQDYDGPAPHHQGPCSGRNGYYTVYNMNTLQPENGKRYEVLVDPYVSDVRFK